MAIAKFRSRARVIDLLGRQQIADVPTAVGELLKNSLDAGARNVWVDFWENEQTLTLRDDGLGMRSQDVLNKWLVLATESRHGEKKLDDGWSKYADLEQREWLEQPSYGEKGIGRLSVATLGRMTLLWTVWGKGPQKKGTLCLVHWHLFQHPTMLFEDLPIPYSEHQSVPTINDVQVLFKQLSGNSKVKLMLKDDNWDPVLKAELLSDLALPLAEPFKKIEWHWQNGTTFCIFSPSDQVDELFLKSRGEIDPLDDYPPDFLKAYHAFSTFWDPFHKKQNRPFSIHPALSGLPLLRTNRYWEPNDFKECDHHIRISVSENGYAKGYIKNYGEEKQVYERQLKAFPKGHSTPGAFLVELGYVQGTKSDSPLPDDLHAEITKRLTHAGGFSIYLNNVRVQPYGGIDSDFAGFEERRLKNAGRYYFSTRRMFGGVFLPSKKQTNLLEKAGREGFVVNGARRGLRYWVEDLFVDLADTFFGRKADRKDKDDKKKQKESAAAKERLEKDKSNYIASVRIHKGWLRDFDNRVKSKVQTVRGLFASEANSYPGTHLVACEKELSSLRSFAEELVSTPSDPPAGVVLEGDVLASVDDYLTKRLVAIRNLNREIATQTKNLHNLSARASGLEEQERRVATRIGDSDKKIRKSITLLLEPALNKAEGLEEELTNFADAEIKRLIDIRQSVLGTTTTKQIARDKSGELAQKLESAIQAQTQEFERTTAPRIRRLVSDISHLTDNTSSALILNEQAQEIQGLKEKMEFLVEMAQLGVVLETATHEHEKQVTEIKSAISTLSKRLDSDSQKLLKSISDSFLIIDERLRLFDPLIRRRSAVDKLITGEEIIEFLKQRFPKEASDSGIIHFTDSFRAASWENVKRPVILGAIHNIVHNAIYWANKGNDLASIRFSAVGGTMVISDSGPGILIADLERIFEPGFSRRPYGRGFGLYIAREALRGIGFELFCPPEPELGALEGANFVIVPKLYVDR